MPIRSEWKLAREGFTIDTIGHLLQKTILNPALTLPLVLLARYTTQGNILSTTHATAFRHLKTLLVLGLASKASEWLDAAVSNNWTNDVYDWSKEVVVVTGGSDGIGKIVVLLLAERGVKVAVLDIQDLTYEAPPTVKLFKCDVMSSASITSAASSIRSHFGNPTVLINNAGVAHGKTILDSTESDLRLTFGINTLSHYFLAQQFLPSMIERNHGCIVTVASMASYVVAPSMVVYAASKVAALAFHEGLSSEISSTYNASKIRTVVICPDYTGTKLFEGFKGRALHPETVAEAIVKAVLKGKSSHIILPETTWLLAPRLRGLPVWFQYGLRSRLANLMKGWNGRQVVQPSEKKMNEEKKEEEKEKGVEESGVLVPGALLS